jgi:hypothetical protein
MKNGCSDRKEIAMFTMNEAVMMVLSSSALYEQRLRDESRVHLTDVLVDQVLEWIGKGLVAVGAWMQGQPRRAPALRAEPGTIG